MRKTILAPGRGELDDVRRTDGLTSQPEGPRPSGDGTDSAASRGTVLHAPDGLDVTLSGAMSPEGDVEEQTREILSYVRSVVCDDLGGELEDVTHLRVFVRDDALTPETRATIHRVRRQTFEWPHYPAATMVGAASLVHDDALVEIEAEAFVPDDGWETAVLDPDDGT